MFNFIKWLVHVQSQMKMLLCLIFLLNFLKQAICAILLEDVIVITATKTRLFIKQFSLLRKSLKILPLFCYNDETSIGIPFWTTQTPSSFEDTHIVYFIAEEFSIWLLQFINILEIRFIHLSFFTTISIFFRFSFSSSFFFFIPPSLHFPIYSFPASFLFFTSILLVPFIAHRISSNSSQFLSCINFFTGTSSLLWTYYPPYHFSRLLFFPPPSNFTHATFSPS